MIKSRKNAKIQSSVLAPFGPKISRVKLPGSVVKKLLVLTDKIVSDENSVSEGPRLFGQIETELNISMEALHRAGLHQFFNHKFKEHAVSVLGKTLGSPIQDNKIDIQLTGAWVNSQFENEYNPIHWHEGCTLSATLYLKIPKYEKRNIPGKTETDGSIVFITDNPSSPMLSLQNPTALFSPNVGEMFIWPSRILHGVYPFKGEGERRSVAINALHRVLM